MTVFIRASVETEREVALLRGTNGSDAARATVQPHEFRWIPGSPFAYWVSSDLRRLFRDYGPYARDGNAVKQGVTTTDDFRFLLASWEAPADSLTARWPSFAKGGPFSPFYTDFELVVRWSDGGAEMYAFNGVSPRGAGAPMRNPTYYFKPGLTWPLRAHRFCPQFLPAGVITSTRGSGIFGPSVRAFAGLGASSVVDHLLKLLSGRLGYPQFDMGDIAVIPVPEVDSAHESLLFGLARSGWSARRSLDTVNEVSHAFVVPAVTQVIGDTFDSRVAAWGGRVAEVGSELVRVQSEIDELCFKLYGISDEDRRAITDGFGVSVTDDADDSLDVEDEVESGVGLDPVGLAAGLVSWAVGVAAGRFDVRLATGELAWPVEPDPFDSLPVCSAGILTGDDGLPVVSFPDGYPVAPSPVLVDDPGHELDLTARVRAVFDVVFGDRADVWWSEVGAALDSRNGVEGWLRRGFFDHHLKTYSKSRRKAPVMWPIGTRSGSYRAWLYAHKVSGDTIFRVLGDVIEPKLASEQRGLSDLIQEFGPSPTAWQRRTLDAQQALVDELTELRDELRAVTPLWHPDLNDGIVLVLAPLWRLFAHNRAWSNELRDRWAKLAKGEYDWAQLAMHIWPERVIPQCAVDRSLAIAHDLEDTFWARDDTNPDKWRPRHKPTTSMVQLFAERANPTIQTARTHPTP